MDDLKQFKRCPNDGHQNLTEEHILDFLVEEFIPEDELSGKDDSCQAINESE